MTIRDIKSGQILSRSSNQSVLISAGLLAISSPFIQRAQINVYLRSWLVFQLELIAFWSFGNIVQKNVGTKLSAKYAFTSIRTLPASAHPSCPHTSSNLRIDSHFWWLNGWKTLHLHHNAPTPPWPKYIQATSFFLFWDRFLPEAIQDKTEESNKVRDTLFSFSPNFPSHRVKLVDKKFSNFYFLSPAFSLFYERETTTARTSYLWLEMDFLLKMDMLVLSAV